MKAKYFPLLAAAASLALASCTKDDGQVKDDLRLRLSTANILAETRAADQNLQLTQFAAKEKVDIFLAESVNGTATTSGSNVTVYDQPLVYTADGAGNLGISIDQYWPASGNGLHIHGVYPSGAAGTDAPYNSTVKSFTVKTDQSTPAGYKASDLMTGMPESNPVARTANAVSLTFTHLLTKVNINLVAGKGFTKSDLSSAKVYVQSTKPTTEFNVLNTTLGTASGPAADILVCTGVKGSAVIVPQTIDASTAFIKVEVGGGEYVYKLGSQTDFKQSSVYTYSITVNKTDLSVMSKISAWTDEGSVTGSASLVPPIPYVTFSAASEQTFKMKLASGVEGFEYSLGGGKWENVTSEAEVRFGGSLGTLGLRGTSSCGTAAEDQPWKNYSTISFTNSSVKVAASGDIRTLVDYKNYDNAETSGARFCSLFAKCTALTSSPALPATNLADRCYWQMFSGCTSLGAAPALPATNLADRCYWQMFSDCTSLGAAPALPATNLADLCYQDMFSGCTSLGAAPALSATNLANQCYQGMFSDCKALKTAGDISAIKFATNSCNNMFKGTGLIEAPEMSSAKELADNCCSGMFKNCTSLTKAPTLPAETLAESCYNSMFSGCTSLQVAPSLPAKTLAPYCYQGMFYGCALKEAPKLPAKTLAEYCYFGMFRKCTSLKTAPDLPATTLSLKSYYGMFQDCSNLTTAPVISATTLAGSCYELMFSGCTSLTKAPELPVRTLASACYTDMFKDCNGLKAAPALPAETLARSCYSGMFSGCTSLKTAPELPAETLAGSCYSGMFSGCTKLTTAPELKGTSLAGSCYKKMFEDCTSLTTAPALPATTVKPNCYQGMFYGCISLTTAPELPAGTLENFCYAQMFSGCTKLKAVKIKAKGKPNNTNEELTGWLPAFSDEDANPTRVISKSKNLDLDTKYIPSGWKAVNFD